MNGVQDTSQAQTRTLRRSKESYRGKEGLNGPLRNGSESQLPKLSPQRLCRRYGRKAPEPSTAGPIAIVSMVILIVILGLFVVILAWLRRTGNPTGLI